MATLKIINQPNQYVQLDDEDVQLLEGHPPRADKELKKVYICKGSDVIALKRLVMGNPNAPVTQLNGDVFDCRKCNLSLMRKSMPKKHSGYTIKKGRHAKIIYETEANTLGPSVPNDNVVDSRITIAPQEYKLDLCNFYPNMMDYGKESQKIATARKLIQLAQEILNDV
jgi:hypothetical protein